MDLVYIPCPLPADEIADVLGLEELRCHNCGQLLEEAYAGDDVYYCEVCVEKLLATLAPEAKAFAVKNCKITADLPAYNPDKEYHCTPEEYDSGDKASYTRNSISCCYRHECTNYDDLIKGLDRNRLSDRVYYAAIRSRIEDLIEAVLPEDECDDEFLDDT